MYEVFKRVVNNEDLDSIGIESSVNLEQIPNQNQQQIKPKEPEGPIPNYKTPSIRAQSIFLLAKHWKPFDPTNFKTVKTEEEGFQKINQLVSFICKMLDKVSKSKSSTIDA